MEKTSDYIMLLGFKPSAMIISDYKAIIGILNYILFHTLNEVPDQNHLKLIAEIKK